VGRNFKEENEGKVLPDSLAWDAMIRDAKNRIEELQLAIEIFEKKKAAGERWPGAQSQEQGSAQQRSFSDTRAISES
jgi:hypothetical protein